MNNDFPKHLSAFLSNYLPNIKGASSNTVSSYSDTFRIFLDYCQNHKELCIETMGLSDISAELVQDFLDWLEKERQCSKSTRNQRLAAISSFFRYAQIYAPECLGEIQKILAIPPKKTFHTEVKYITFDDIKCILEQPDCSSRKGRRDRILLCLLYDTGARVSELTGIRIRDIRLDAPAQITLCGKGSKKRSVPLMEDTAKCLAEYMEENNLAGTDKKLDFLFSPQNGRRFTRAGISYILNKYAEAARPKCAALPEKVTPHVFRHSKAMHLLQAGVNIVYIKDILGHTDVTTTQVYLKADLKMKAEALAKAKIEIKTEPPGYEWTSDKDLMQWLAQLGRQTR